MRRLSLLLVVAAPLLLSACDPAKFSGKDEKEDTSGATGGLPPSAIRDQTRGTARQLQDAFDQSQALAANSDDPGRVTFDGTGVLPNGASLRDAPNGVNTGVTPRYGPRPSIEYADGDPRKPVVGPVPAPGPLANLPPATAAVGDLAKGAGPTLLHFDAFQRTAGLFRRVFDVVSRVTWGAQAARRAGYRQNPDRIAIHHTVTEQTTDLQASIRVVKRVQHYHRNVADGRKGLWDDIGYHFLIDGAGRVFEGRHAELMGAHAGSGGNPHSVAISMIGDFDRNQLTDSQRDGMVRLVSFLSMKYRKDPSAVGFIEPHQHFMSTDCPGRNVLAFLKSQSLIRESRQVLAQLRGDSRFQPVVITPPA